MPSLAVVLRPLPITRIANTTLGTAVAMLAWPLSVELSGLAAYAALIPVAAGATLAVRAYRMSVSLERDGITVRGLLWSRTIRRSDVVALTSFPALKWRHHSGHHVYTPLTVFLNLGNGLPMVGAHNEACLDRLSKAVRRR